MNDTFALFFVTWAFISVTLFFVYVTLMKRCNAGMLYREKYLICFLGFFELANFLITKTI